jgi:hypothetical protein
MTEGLSSSRGWKFFSSPHHPDWLWGPPSQDIQCVPGALFLGVKRLGHEADHSPPSNAKVKNAWSYITIPSKYAFMAWCSVKVQGQLYLYLIIMYLRKPYYRPSSETSCISHISQEGFHYSYTSLDSL